MTSSRPNEPVLHCTAAQFLLVYLLASRIINQGIYFNTTVFTTPPVDIAAFKAAVKALSDLIISAKGNTNNKKSRDSQSIAVFKLLKILLPYVSVLANHDINIILASGFDCNNQPQKSPVPKTPVITDVIVGEEDGTYKVKLERKKNKTDVLEDPATHPKNVKYTAESSVTPDDPKSWRMVCTSVSSTKIIFKDVTLNQKNYIRVYGVNAAGKGQASKPFPFTPQL